MTCWSKRPSSQQKSAAKLPPMVSSQRVHLLGSMSDLSPFYERADIFVLASHYEGYGMVFAEALRHGLPGNSD